LEDKVWVTRIGYGKSRAGEGTRIRRVELEPEIKQHARWRKMRMVGRVVTCTINRKVAGRPWFWAVVADVF
jgi:hypothetical protein